MNDCNEQKTEKCHECTNIEQLETTPIMMAIVVYLIKRTVFTNFMAASFLLDRAYEHQMTRKQIPVKHILIHNHNTPIRGILH
jgi:hypothetical protein